MNTPTDKDLIDFAVAEQFILFCDEDEFVDIARAVLQRFAAAPPAPDGVSGVSEAMVEAALKAWFGNSFDPELDLSADSGYPAEMRAAITAALAAQVAEGAKDG